MEKLCRKCNVLQSEDNFWKNKVVCKRCCHDHYLANKGEISKRNKAWREKNRDRHNESRRAWNEANRDKAKQWREENKDRVAANKRRLYYGLTQEQYEDMLLQSGGKCSICKEHTTKLHVDHDHVTGKVRGLLCRACNHGIGNFKDDTALLTAAIGYLESHKENV